MKVKHCNLIKPLSCEPKTPVHEAAGILREAKQRRIIVTENGSVKGIISTTDMNNRVVAENRLGSELKAREIMTSPVFLIVDYEEELAEVYKKMIDHNSFFVPVTKEGKLFAILMYAEIVRSIEELMKNG